ncbi:MAG TPA: DUF1015 domain-containing protein [Bacteroidales bacterium]|jgi:uncharacterized protein (DUF1015 family)|nr:DUF1015 domain-containing protein [Bacteroidales bacterium]HPY21710.1 DUF1015 domain-containing protein [Bacteroidales bacterium]HQA92922.1 DUF1015 domain-containing protein [Bacteroidales bacterium]HQN24594.1 DUF1015 domain-containing protein [Bacteroidales bacterium]HQP79714.1 DUF1015 domain-containing protein [Bacteroidales bacterium]
MVKIKPFAAIRPPKAIVKEVAARPYDVLNSVEAKAEAGEKSLLHITKPEIDFDPIIDEHSQPAYDKAVENFKLWMKRGWLVQDTAENYYVYAQTMDGRTQYGLVVCANVEDYLTGKIKKHELTRKDKEEDRMIHVRIQNANVEPVFFTYPDNKEINALVSRYAAGEPEYDFVADDGFGHHLWVISDKKDIARITELFAGIPAFYVADGHHRTAAAALVGEEQRRKNPNHTGDEEYNYFMAVVFPESHLKIIDYNRVVKDLNGMTPKEFVEALKEDFIIETKGSAEPYRPSKLHNFSMYLEGEWYSLTAKPGTYDDNDPIGVLDVTICSNLIFDKLLDIKDLRTCTRIDFVGGIRGLGELKKRVDSGEMAAAFALYPVSMRQLINIADTGNIMPPKTTWFEPKLRSGLTIHKLER